ncbi:hypothetical protein HAX54_025839, partial [Datura stramonium]|nr:hypothetical protein [Datura stramonium]
CADVWFQTTAKSTTHGKIDGSWFGPSLSTKTWTNGRLQLFTDRGSEGWSMDCCTTK